MVFFLVNNNFFFLYILIFIELLINILNYIYIYILISLNFINIYKKFNLKLKIYI